ncbi:hypothetical protein Dip510_002150 [Elusimicrobium posterum]|uniref:hypothetical protein n=1 Tax=Elusimicrobium posterum TaxID=3116653 RepID=UPI003C726562
MKKILTFLIVFVFAPLVFSQENGLQKCIDNNGVKQYMAEKSYKDIDALKTAFQNALSEKEIVFQMRVTKNNAQFKSVGDIVLGVTGSKALDCVYQEKLAYAKKADYDMFSAAAQLYNMLFDDVICEGQKVGELYEVNKATKEEQSFNCRFKKEAAYHKANPVKIEGFKNLGNTKTGFKDLQGNIITPETKKSWERKKEEINAGFKEINQN